MRKNDQRKSKKNGKFLWENLSCCFVAADFMQLDDQFHCSFMDLICQEMDSLDTGGFDMDVGEGTGQLPEDWEESYGGDRK